MYGSVIVPPEVAEEYGIALPEWITVQAVTDANKIMVFHKFIGLGNYRNIGFTDPGLQRKYHLRYRFDCYQFAENWVSASSQCRNPYQQYNSRKVKCPFNIHRRAC